MEQIIGRSALCDARIVMTYSAFSKVILGRFLSGTLKHGEVGLSLIKPIRMLTEAFFISGSCTTYHWIRLPISDIFIKNRSLTDWSANKVVTYKL